MITRRTTSKAQTTVPQPVPAALGLRPGDELEYATENRRVVLTRHEAHQSVGDPFATFSEWTSEADAAAFGNL